jgi:acetyl-CoA C-acetyltransferase
VQPHANRVNLRNDRFEQNRPGIYATMIETADLVAARYRISREAQDVFAFESQTRTAAAKAASLFDDEMFLMRVRKNILG